MLNVVFVSALQRLNGAKEGENLFNGEQGGLVVGVAALRQEGLHFGEARQQYIQPAFQRAQMLRDGLRFHANGIVQVVKVLS
jgi:hypothetical protein